MAGAAIRLGRKNSIPPQLQSTGSWVCSRSRSIRSGDTGSTATRGKADVMDRDDVRSRVRPGQKPSNAAPIETDNSAGVRPATIPSERSSNARVSVPFSSLPHLLEHQARRIPDAPAILASGRAPLTYRRLYEQVDKMGRTLRAAGIDGRDRVAVVLPNGSEMPVAILAVAGCAACAPVNPAFGVEELNRYFEELQPRALILQAGIDSPARRVAHSSGIRVIELSTAPTAEAGIFELSKALGPAQSLEEVKPDDVALLLPTSGTTSQPKIVRQTHVNICTSACLTSAALTLTET